MSQHDPDVRESLFGPLPPASERSNRHNLEQGSITRATGIRQGTATVADENDKPDEAAHAAADRRWHSTLVRMLSMLDSARSSFERAASERDPVSAVRIAATITHQVADFIAANVNQEENSVAVGEALAAAARFLTAAQVASATGPKKKFFGILGTTPADPARLEECMWVLRDLPLVLERYFALLGSAFHNQSLNMDWIETSGTFIAELKHTLQWVDGFTTRQPQSGRSSSRLEGLIHGQH